MCGNSAEAFPEGICHMYDIGEVTFKEYIQVLCFLSCDVYVLEIIFVTRTSCAMADRPLGTPRWAESELQKLATRDTMLGVALPVVV